MVKNPPANAKKCRFDPWVRKIPWRRTWQPTQLIVFQRIPWTEAPGGLQSIALQRVRQDCRDLAHTHYSIIWKYQSFFIRIYQTIFQSGCAILHYRRQRIKVPVASHSSQQFIVSFLDFNHPKKYVLCLIVVLVWISLMTNDVCKDWMFVSPEDSNKKKYIHLGQKSIHLGERMLSKLLSSILIVFRNICCILAIIQKEQSQCPRGM